MSSQWRVHLYFNINSHCISPCVVKVMTPTRVGQAYIYSPAPSNSQDLYDVPPMRTQGVSMFSLTELL